jgi:hypothetical protein
VIDRRINVLPIRDVSSEHRRLAADSLHLIRDGAGLFVVNVHDRDIGAVACKPPGDRVANPLACPGHECHFSVDAHAWLEPFATLTGTSV